MAISSKLLILLSFIIRNSNIYALTPDYYSLLGIDKYCKEKEIKKIYRKLALEYHPDKLANNIGKNYTLEWQGKKIDKEEAKELFLKIQEAYEILSDEEKKMKYDLSLDGIQYDILDDIDKDENIYEIKPFKTFIKTSKFKIMFEADFERPPIPVLFVNINIELSNVFHPISQNVTYFKRKICAICNGNGGLSGECRQCTLCNGSGIAKHYFSHFGHKFDSITETTCLGCLGKGCITTNKCIGCGGKGTLMEENTQLFSLPVGVKNGANIVYEGQGHESRYSQKGDLMLITRYLIPDGWSYDDSTGGLKKKVVVDFISLTTGFEYFAHLLSGEKVKVTVNPITNVGELLSGVDLTIENYGTIINENGDRASCDFHFDADWTSITREGLEEILDKIFHLNNSDIMYKRLMSVFNSSSNFKKYSDNREQYIINIEDITISKESKEKSM